MLRSFLPHRPQRCNAFIAGLLVALLGGGIAQQAVAAHAYAQFGEPKYPAHFEHFDYVAADAPKGGTLRLSVIATNSNFDKYNPFTLRGRVAPGVLELMFETLAVYSMDERNTQYGLLAEDIEVAGDFSSVTFRLRSQARFNTGEPVLAADVQHSLETLKSAQASPRFQSYFKDIERAEVLDERTVRFHFSRRGRDLPFVAGNLPVFSRSWGRNPDGSATSFDELALQAPISSGPYLIDPTSGRQDIRFRRNPHYWGTDINVRRGMYNFDDVVFYLYSDMDSRRAALRSGTYDFVSETQMYPWRVNYFGRLFDSGELVKQVLPHHNPPAMNGWVVNLRRERFSDVRVRKALNYLFDFEWLNDRQFSGRFQRMGSYFARTELAATGLPDPDELALLAPYRDQLPPAVFGPMVELPSTHAPSSMRHSFAKAIALFEEAGWTLRDGVLRNAQGEPFVLEMSVATRKQSVQDSVYLNMQKAGIQVIRKVGDAATSQRRLSRFDFDYSLFGLRESRMPGEEIWRAFNSEAADIEGSENIAGVKSEVVDELTQKLMAATTHHEQVTVARALDRVLMHNYYFIHWRYLPDHYVIHHRRLQKPAQLPLYYAAQEWAIMTWWDAQPAQ